MGQHSDKRKPAEGDAEREWQPEDVALILWQNATDIPAKIRAMGGLFKEDEEDDDSDAVQAEMSANIFAIFEAAALEYESAGQAASNFERATTLAPQFSASVSTTAQAVWKAVQGLGEVLESEGS